MFMLEAKLKVEVASEIVMVEENEAMNVSGLRESWKREETIEYGERRT